MWARRGPLLLGGADVLRSKISLVALEPVTASAKGRGSEGVAKRSIPCGGPRARTVGSSPQRFHRVEERRQSRGTGQVDDGTAAGMCGVLLLIVGFVDR